MNEIEEQKFYSLKIKEMNQNKTLKYFILTMGCQLNENDSEKLCGILEQMGYQKTDIQSQADLVVLNTCCVRENAEDKLFGKLGELKRQKEERGIMIAIGGCMMQEKHITAKIKESYPFVDILFGTHTLYKFPENLYRALKEKKKLEDIIDIEGKIYEGLPIKRNSNIKASVTIMNGCNNFCSYCIIPYARGRICSRKPESVLEEIDKIANKGIKEVVITGIQVSSYGKDFDNNYRLIDLLEEINKIRGIERIRLGSLEPVIITDEFCARIYKIEKLCHHFHLSLQSGCDKTLKEMNRKYTISDFEKVVQRLRNLYEDVILTTDIIVGFPNETDEDFEITYNFLEKIKFYKMHVFKYSQRKGTVAAKMRNQISSDEKEKRSKKLLELSVLNEQDYLKKYLNKEVKVLFEESNGEFLKGHTGNYILVKAKVDNTKLNEIVSVKVTSVETENLVAE